MQSLTFTVSKKKGTLQYHSWTASWLDSLTSTIAQEVSVEKHHKTSHLCNKAMHVFVLCFNQFCKKVVAVRCLQHVTLTIEDGGQVIMIFHPANKYEV